MSDLDNYISTVFLGSSKTNIMELFQYISSRTITDLLITDSVQNMDGPGSAESSYGTFFKTIIVGGIIGATFITLVGAHCMPLQKKISGKTSEFVKHEIILEAFRLSCDTTSYLTLEISRNIVNTRSFNEYKIPSTAEFHSGTHPITIDMDPDHNTLEILMKIVRINRVVL